MQNWLKPFGNLFIVFGLSTAYVQITELRYLTLVDKAFPLATMVTGVVMAFLMKETWDSFMDATNSTRLRRLRFLAIIFIPRLAVLVYFIGFMFLLVIGALD